MLTKEKDEDLALFFDMRGCENEKDGDNFVLHAEPKELGSYSEIDNQGSSPNSKTVSSMPTRKFRGDDFLNTENEKSDYDWLLTPPVTPLFSSLEMDSQKNATCKNHMLDSCPIALQPRLQNIQAEPVSRSSDALKHRTLQSGSLSSSSAGNRRPSLSGGATVTAPRSATPTGRPALSKTGKPSRPITPSSWAILHSKIVVPPVRSSTPTRAAPRSMTPTARPSLTASKSKPRSATPTNHPVITSGPCGRSSSISKSHSRGSSNPLPSQGNWPSVKSLPSKRSEMPGFSSDAAPNLRSSEPQRPTSASRGRPRVSGAKLSTAVGSNGKVRKPSCSPARQPTLKGSINSSGNSITEKHKPRCDENDEVNPVLMGTQMVERVVNMRKLAPPKQEDHCSNHSNSAGKSSHADNSGFGRTISKSSLDMALRHMDISGRMPGTLRPALTNIPPASTYSVNPGPTRSGTVSVSDSPLATSSNTSSDPSFSNTSIDEYDLRH